MGAQQRSFIVACGRKPKANRHNCSETEQFNHARNTIERIHCTGKPPIALFAPHCAGAYCRPTGAHKLAVLKAARLSPRSDACGLYVRNRGEPHVPVWNNVVIFVT